MEIVLFFFFPVFTPLIVSVSLTVLTSVSGTLLNIRVMVDVLALFMISVGILLGCSYSVN